MSKLLARWDVTPEEQAHLPFGQVLTLINVRRAEVACLLGLSTRLLEAATGFRSVVVPFELALLLLILLLSLAYRNRPPTEPVRWAVIVAAVAILLVSQSTVAVLASQDRITSGYQTMLLSLSLLFVAPPRRIALPLLAMLAVYASIVLTIGAGSPVKVVAIANAAIVTVISFFAIALIHSARRRDYEQRREIRAQNERLQQRNAELDSLMAITAHDLRSPLFGLRNLFDLAIRRAPQDPGLPLAVLKQGMASLNSMLALATRLLDAHATEAQLPVALVEEEVAGHLEAAASRIVPLARSTDVTVRCNLPEGELVAQFEPASLAQILDNLLSNAVRFSPPGTTVALSVAREGARIAIRVRDTGPGVDPALEPQLFGRFGTIQGEPTALGMPRKGLGLFIVANLAERMGATIHYERASEGGATFLLRIKAS